MNETLPKFDPDSDYPYPKDEFTRAALDRLRSRRKTVRRVISVASMLRLRPYDPDTGEARSAFDEIWYWATEIHDLTNGPETWIFHSSRLAAFPSNEITGWHDLPMLDLASMDDWDQMWLPKVLSPGKVYACTRCTFTTCRDDRARKHDRDDHPDDKDAELGLPLTSSQYFEVVDEGSDCRRPGLQNTGEGQHSLTDFGGNNV